MLPVPSDAQGAPGARTGQMRAGKLTEEEWRELLVRRLPEGATGLSRDFNSTRYYDVMVRAIEAVTTEERRRSRLNENRDPVERFLFARAPGCPGAWSPRT